MLRQFRFRHLSRFMRHDAAIAALAVAIIILPARPAAARGGDEVKKA